MDLACKRCGAAIGEDGLDRARHLAHCPQCDLVCDTRTDAPAVAKGNATIPMPKNIQLNDIGHQFHMTRRWLSAHVVYLILLCLVWNGVLVVWYRTAVNDGSWLMLIPPLLHVVVGTLLLYYTLACIVNVTHFRVRDDMLHVRHWPLPMPGKLDVTARDIAQIFAVEHSHHTRNGPKHHYSVNLLMQDESQRKLVGKLAQPEQALFIERALESYLGIVDQPVPGDYT